MARSKPDFGLPLLHRELTQLSARRMTYVYRTAFAAFISIVSVVMLWEMSFYGYALNMLGRGRDLLEGAVQTGFAGIYLLLPVMTCGAITEEKERGALSLLLLTRLGPWTILFEKLLSRLLSMAGLLVLTLPLVAVGYSMGGVSLGDLFCGMFLLLIGCLQVISISLACSAYCRKTTGAFLSTITLGFMIIVSPAVLEEMGWISIRHEELMFPPALFEEMFWRPLSFTDLLWLSIPNLLVISASLFVARVFLVTRLEATSSNLPSTLLTGIDRVVHSGLAWATSGRIRLSQQRRLPVDRPIFWRESNGHLLNHPRRRLYAGILATIAVLIGFAFVAESFSDGPWRNDEELAFVYFAFLAVAALTVVSRSATMLATERSRQTLDLLLTTPMTNREIVEQKLSGVFLLTRVFAFPYLVLVIGDAMIKSVDWQVWFHQRGIEYSASFYVLASSVTFVIYLTMLTWLAVLIGLRVKKQITALFVALAAILAWAIVPIALIIGCFELTGISERDPEAVMLLASPLSFLLLNEFYELRVLGQPAWLLFVLNCTLYGTITWLLRRYCLTHLDSLLARNDRRLGTV